jgi:hypothetical protein
MSEARAKRILFSLLLAAVVLSAVSQLNADTMFFTNGRSITVRDHQISGDLVTVTLRQGGEATFHRSLISRIVPDEFVPAQAGVAPELSEPSLLVSESSMPVALQPLAGRPFADLIETVALKHGVDPVLIHAVIKAESNYRPGATSQMGARGLMQVMPTTGASYGIWNLYDPQANLEAGVQYLKFLLERFNLTQAIAAYNAGPGAVRKYRGVPPYPETQNYVKKVLANFLQ